MEGQTYLEDIYPQNLLYAVTIRSPVANGILQTISLPVFPENYFCITSKDIPGENRLEDTDIPILAESKLSYIGEPVALLVGPEKPKLLELLNQCIVFAEEKIPVFTVTDAVKLASNQDTKLAAARNIQVGDSQSLFEKSSKIVAGSYITGIQDHWYAEPAGAVTWYEDDTLIVKTATQWPNHVKRSITRALGIDILKISVEPTSLSLHMDGKLLLPSHIACHSALGTMIAKKPVRLILNREEDFLYSPKRCMTNIDIMNSIDENGNITAADIDIFVNLGAYGVNGNEILDQICLGTLSFYDYPNLTLNAKAVNTNIPPQGPFSGFGIAQGAFATERQISLIADSVNQEPAQWRKTHTNVDNINPLKEVKQNEKSEPSNIKNKSSVINELIDTTTKISDYYRKWASYELLRSSRKEKQVTQEKGENLRGIGIAIGFQGNSLLYHGEDKGIYEVEVTLTEEEKLIIKSNISDSDNSINKIWEKMAFQILSINPEKVIMEIKKTPDSGPSCASRNITTVTTMVEKCFYSIKEMRLQNPLPITVQEAAKPQHGVLRNGALTAADGKLMDINGFKNPGMAAAVVEIDIDLIECIPKIRGIWLVIDGGRIISKNRAKRNLMRGVIQAIGWSYSENIKYTNGVLPQQQYDNFVILPPADYPPVTIEFFPDNSSLQTNDKSVNRDYESKGIGELPFTCIPAAYLQAVSQAMDYGYKEIPLGRKEIWEIIRLRTSEIQLQGSK